MNERSTCTSWQIAGTAVLTAWILAACGLNSDGATPASNGRVDAENLAAPETPRTSTAPERRVAARIESGEITRIERVALAAPPRSAEEQIVYRIVVRLEDGRSREFTEPSLGELKVGDRVQVVRSSTPPTT